MKKAFVLCGLAFLVASFVGTTDKAEARPQHLKQFTEQYPTLADKAKEAKCVICHDEKDKKIRNDYGKAVGKGFTEKNVKDVEVIKKAIEGAEKEKNSDGKSYGDIIKSGALPN